MVLMIDQFRASLERLSAPPDEQQAYLERLGTAPSADELGLEFDDAFLAVREALPERVADAAARLEQFLSSFGGSKNAELWTVLALGHAPEWRQVRELARKVLREMSD